MSEKHLHRYSHKVRGLKSAWWYEENRGISVIVQPSQEHSHINISWKELRNALARKDKKP